MVRECAAALLILPTASCSWILDFSDRAIPADARPDAPYSQAECDYKEPNDAIAAAAPIAPGDTGPAAICAQATEDHDFYRFTVPAMTTRVEIQLSTTYFAAGDLDLRVYDRTGTKIAESHNFADDELITCPGSSPRCPALAAADYVFEVFPGVPGAANRYTFSLVFSAM